MAFEQHIPVITVDGPSGTGKGTISKKLVDHLNWNFLDSGAIYRVLAFAAQKSQINLEDITALVRLAHHLQLEFELDSNKNVLAILNGNDVSQEIRSENSGLNASKIAANPEVREALLARQRAFAKPPGLIADGRDMGTVVFPDADLKIYLDATPEERAKRRYLQLKENRNDVSLAQVVEDLAKRDAKDMARKHAPLKAADDAVKIDTTDLSIVQVFNHVLKLVDKRVQNR